MVELFLSKPAFDEEGDGSSVQMGISLLNKVESVLWSLMTNGGRLEARLWLCKTLATITSISPNHQRYIFVSLLRLKPLRRDLASQLLQLIYDKRPDRAGAVLAKRSYVVKKFFEGNPHRISQWFSNFDTSGGSEHGKGAKALSQFAFKYRDICWEELEWRGKHGQSPAVVATKPHYFLDLDVQYTIENFLQNVPEFWSSDEFTESLKDGEILYIDRKYFLDYFVDWMFEEDFVRIWEIVNDFLMEESFSSLCQYLLVTLEENDFCYFMEMLLKYLNPEIKPRNFGNSSYLLEVILSKCSDCGSIDQILLLNAVINHGRQLLCLLRDEEAQEEQAKIKDLVKQICVIQSTYDLAAIIKECSKRKTIEAAKWLGLQSWVLHYIMSEECKTPNSWESLFADNAIKFQKIDKFVLLDPDELSEEIGFESDHIVSKKIKHRKRKRSRKVRRRKFDNEDDSENELWDIKNDEFSSQLNEGSWFLSTDGYALAWNAVSFP